MTMKTSWRELIGDALRRNGEDWADVVSITLSSRELSKRFEISYGGPSGMSFAAWTARHVYFPLCYDGMDSCGCAPRNPQAEPLAHQGG